MSWTWTFTDEAGGLVAPEVLSDAAGDAVVGGARNVSPAGQPPGDQASFSSQGDAETWLGEHWRVLAAAGIAAARLVHDGRDVYGPLQLTAN